jgi:hypothetical protein
VPALGVDKAADDLPHRLAPHFGVVTQRIDRRGEGGGEILEIAMLVLEIADRCRGCRVARLERAPDQVLLGMVDQLRVVGEIFRERREGVIVGLARVDQHGELRFQAIEQRRDCPMLAAQFLD